MLFHLEQIICKSIIKALLKGRNELALIDPKNMIELSGLVGIMP
jgi:hypothetical protein